jgi:hypothetical protein
MSRIGIQGPAAAAVVTAAVALTAAVGLMLPRPVAAQSCDRDCLGGIMTQFLESLVAQDPSKAPLADGARFTEDAKELPVGGGFWATASKLGAYRTDFLDVREQTAAVHAVMEENGTPVLFAARLKVEDREITEIETMVVRGQAEAMLFDLTRLDRPSAAFTAMPPRDQRNTREELIDIAMRYPEGLRVGSFVTSDVPFAADAYRLENGQLMGGRECTFIPGCNDMRNQRLPVLAEIKGEVVAVDEENGTVLARLDFGRGSLMGGRRGGGAGGPAAAGGDAAAPELVLVTFEAFKIYGGQVHAVEAVFESMPRNAPRGWE